MASEASGADFEAIKSKSFDQHSCSNPPTRYFPLKKRQISPEQVLKSFNTRAFKREQPDNPERIKALLSRTLAREEPISFVLYWGKGMRPALAAPELTCLNYLASMIARVVASYVHGAQLSLVFTDTHAALNGHSQGSIRSYFEDLTLAAGRHQFDTCLISKLIEESELRPEATDLRIPPDDVLNELMVSAAKWFRGNGTAREGAIRYYQANMFEKKVMDIAFPRSIFITFNGSELRSLFPDNLPIFYMYSLRHGVSDKPWFLPADYDGSKKSPKDPQVLHDQAV